jgi:hypothetical protein
LCVSRQAGSTDVRARTAVGVAIGIVAAKATLTWVALMAWRSLPERPSSVGQWRIQLGTVGEWLAAIFTAVAVAVALGIAGHESRTRRRERAEADHAQARLVQVKVKQVRGLPDFDVEIHNYGDRAIIGAAITNAWWFVQPGYTWRHSDVELDRVPIVKPDRDDPSGGSVRIQFTDAESNLVPKLLEVDARGAAHFEDVAVMPDAVAVFMDANGTLWETGSAIAPRRITSPPVRF